MKMISTFNNYSNYMEQDTCKPYSNNLVSPKCLNDSNCVREFNSYWLGPRIVFPENTAINNSNEPDKLSYKELITPNNESDWLVKFNSYFLGPQRVSFPENNCMKLNIPKLPGKKWTKPRIGSKEFNLNWINNSPDVNCKEFDKRQISENLPEERSCTISDQTGENGMFKLTPKKSNLRKPSVTFSCLSGNNDLNNIRDPHSVTFSGESQNDDKNIYNPRSSLASNFAQALFQSNWYDSKEPVKKGGLNDNTPDCPSQSDVSTIVDDPVNAQSNAGKIFAEALFQINNNSHGPKDSNLKNIDNQMPNKLDKVNIQHNEKSFQSKGNKNNKISQKDMMDAFVVTTDPKTNKTESLHSNSRLSKNKRRPLSKRKQGKTTKVCSSETSWFTEDHSTNKEKLSACEIELTDDTSWSTMSSTVENKPIRESDVYRCYSDNDFSVVELKYSIRSIQNNKTSSG